MGWILLGMELVPRGKAIHVMNDGVGPEEVPLEPQPLGETCICFPSYCQVPINAAGWNRAM